MRLHLTGSATASLILRIGLGVEFLMFGYGKLVDVGGWIAFIPPWMSPLLPASVGTFLTVIGVAELLLGVLLLIGLWTRVIAVLAALHLVGVLVAVGYNDLAIRDFVALASALALAALGPAGCHYSIDGHRTTASSPHLITSPRP
ncbi:DoxX family membrane protein [Candidatus Uhrbacteria bacterium]|nr:DoxX family membrane protein [Candidatus Uhrbacteria bacterium]